MWQLNLKGKLKDKKNEVRMNHRTSTTDEKSSNI